MNANQDPATPKHEVARRCAFVANLYGAPDQCLRTAAPGSDYCDYHPTVTFSVMYMTAIRYQWEVGSTVTHKGQRYRITNLTDQYIDHRRRYLLTVRVEAVPLQKEAH